MTLPKIFLVLGSGATVGGGFQVSYNGTLWKPPMDYNFFETPLVQSILSTGDYPALTHYKQGSSLEINWAKIDLYYKLCNRKIITEEESFRNIQSAMKTSRIRGYAAKMNKEKEKSHFCVPSMALWELRWLVRTVFCKLTTPSDAVLFPLKRLIQRLNEDHLLQGIVTFNYELSAELALQEISSNPFFYPPFETIKSAGQIPLMKLHGSLNWQYSEKSTSKICVRSSFTSIAQMDYVHKKNYVQPEIIGPTFFKQEITWDDRRSSDYRFKRYNKLWQFTWKELKKTAVLVFIGFSFPRTDFHAAALFRTAHLSGSGFRRVILCHFRDANLRRTAEQVFAGKATEFMEFRDGLQDMVDRVEELVKLLSA